MFGLFKRDPLARLQRDHQAKLAAAAEKQRNGDLHAYADLTAEAEEIERQIEALEAERA